MSLNRNARRCADAVILSVAAALLFTLATGAIPLSKSAKTMSTSSGVVAKVDPRESCVRNATHCTCGEKAYRPLVEASEYPGFCTLDPVERDGFVCGCPGNTLCEIKEYACASGSYKKLRAIGTFDEQGRVQCESATSTGETCRKSTAVKTCSEFSNVFVDGALVGCVSNIPVVSDVDDAFGLVDGRVNKIDALELDMINIRVIETLSSKNIHMCVVYGNWDTGSKLYPNDNALSRKAKARVTATSPLAIELPVDPSEEIVGDGTTELLITSEQTVAQSEGFCIGPFLNDGSGFRAEFYELNSSLGVNVQTFEHSTSRIESLTQWKFAEHNAVSTLYADGRTNGDDRVTLDVVPTCECGATAPSPLEPATVRPIDPIDATSQCVKNSTHCSCSEKQWRPLVFLGDDTCSLDAERDGFACACPGTSLCAHTTASEPCTKLMKTGEVDAQGHVQCKYVDGQTCSKTTDASPCSDSVKMFVNGADMGCASSAPVNSNVDEMYGLTAGAASVLDGAMVDYINIRSIKTTSDGELHVCVVYGNAAQGEAVFGTEDNTLRREKVKITAAFDINIELKDDADDAYFGDGTSQVMMSHVHKVFKTDGFCIGPVLGDGSGVRAVFYDLDNMLGVNVQTYDGSMMVSQSTWTFADHAPANELAADGRANGDESVTVDILPSCSCSSS